MSFPADEHRLYQRLIEPLDELQRRMSLPKPATLWHRASIARMLRDAEWAEATLETSIGDDEAGLSTHLKQLPEILIAIQAQDQVCETAWRKGRASGNFALYEQEREELIAQFQRVRIRWRAYERIARQRHKPLVEQARVLVPQNDDDRDGERSRLMDLLRMELADYLENECAIALLLEAVEHARAEVVRFHESWASGIAEGHYPGNDVARAGALCGLEGAARYYDHRRGYPFRTYAQWWVQKFMERAISGDRPKD